MHNHEFLSDLEWLAFRYVADELEPAERAAFEHTLDTDQAAREAVARMVELTMTVAAGGPEPVGVAWVTPAQSQASWNYPVMWVSLGALACSLLFLVFGSPFIDLTLREAKTPVSSPRQKDTTALASAWMETRREWTLPEDELYESTLASDGQEMLADASELWNEEHLAQHFQPPSWMLAAVEDELSEETSPDGAE